MSDYKICLVGSSNAGKTAFLNKLVHNKFKRKYSPTIGCIVQSVDVIDAITNQLVRFNMWDITSDNKLCDLFYTYIKDADAIFMMFDVSNYDRSIAECNDYFNIIRNHSPNTPIIWIGNKIDLNPSFVNNTDREYNYMSVKTGKNIYTPFHKIMNY